MLNFLNNFSRWNLQEYYSFITNLSLHLPGCKQDLSNSDEIEKQRLKYSTHSRKKRRRLSKRTKGLEEPRLSGRGIG